MEQNVEQQGNKERQVNRKSNLVYGRIKRRIGQVKYETILDSFMTKSRGRNPV